MVSRKYQKGYSIVSKNSNVEYYKFVIPTNLYHSSFEARFDVIIKEGE
jgi:hypothetical protein